MSKLKDKIIEFSEIAKSLPDNFQVICFELLLKNHLEGGKPPQRESAPPPESPAPSAPLAELQVTPAADLGNKQEDLLLKDLHVKTKKFIEKYAVTLDQLNNLFFKENGEIKPLYDDLKTTRTSESQIRIALLLALQSAISTGDFEIETESVRQQCVERKCYAGTNFAANFKNNKSLFDFDEYTGSTLSVRLSENGKKELADIIKELQ